MTKFDSSVVTGSSPNENENIHSPNVPMFSLRSEVIYEKCSSENLPQEVSIKEVEKESRRLSLNMTKISYLYLADFLKTNLTKFVVIVIKEKERRKRKSEEKERKIRKESNGCTLSFYNSYFGDNNFWSIKTV